jgi:hypothetical protein
MKPRNSGLAACINASQLYWEDGRQIPIGFVVRVRKPVRRAECRRFSTMAGASGMAGAQLGQNRKLEKSNRVSMVERAGGPKNRSHECPKMSIFCPILARFDGAI